MGPFEALAQKLIELHFHDFLLPALITATILYGLLRKTKILGDSPVINGVLSLSIAFLIFIFPQITGIALGGPLASFFTQAMVWILIILVGILLASFFYPNLTKMLTELFTRRTTFYIMIALGIALFITSGLLTAMIGGVRLGARAPSNETAAPTTTHIDIIIMAVGLILFIILIMIASAIGRGEM